MESLQSVLLTMNLRDWMLSLDLLDAYLKIQIHPIFQKYLSFSVNHQHFQFQSLHFGISTAHRTFMKVPVSSNHTLEKDHYLDDILLLSSNRDTVVQRWKLLIYKLQNLSLEGWGAHYQDL